MWRTFKTVASYIIPLVSHKMSRYNGMLSIVLENGHTVLNTRDANYSYGSLHRIMRFAIGEIDFHGTDDILLLGLGGGSVVALLRDDFHLSNTIRAVDVDSVIIEVARQRFALDTYADVEVICQDASIFVAETSKRHGLIIMDLFINNIVPAQFYDETFWQHIVRILTPDGRIIFNTISSTTNHLRFREIIDRLGRSGFTVTIHHGVDRTNQMIFARR